jgi:hypothetical protein
MRPRYVTTFLSCFLYRTQNFLHLDIMLCALWDSFPKIVESCLTRKTDFIRHMDKHNDVIIGVCVKLPLRWRYRASVHLDLLVYTDRPVILKILMLSGH